MKKIILEFGFLIGKTILVTAVVVLGFGLCGLLGLPSWAQGFGLVPAAYVFCRLAGEGIPSVRRWPPFLLGLTLLQFALDRFFPHVPESYRTAAFMAFVVVAPNINRLIPSPAGQARQEPPPAR